MDELLDRVSSLGAELKGYPPATAAEAVRLYLDGLSAYQAARETRVREQRLREWVKLLGVKRSEEAAMAMRRAGGRAGAALQLERQREAAALRCAAAGEMP